MYKILNKVKIAEETVLMDIEAKEIARKAKPGQFIILRIDEKGERIPLTIAGYNNNKITIVFQVVGRTTKQLSLMKKGDSILDFAGPLGNPSNIKKIGNVCVVGGGLGIAPVYPIAKALKQAGNKVTCIIGARNKERLFWLDKFSAVSDKLIVCTDDGSYGRKALVTEPLKEVIEKEKLEEVIAVGPPIMMKSVCLTTKDKVRTIVSMNSIMVDGTGMCGGCRVNVGSERKFACVDGPEFDGSKVDWDLLINRNSTYKEEEKIHQKCSCGLHEPK